jgi:hypothetical protein
VPILGVIGSGISSRLWAPAGAYDSISTATVTSGGTSSITFSSIPQTYTHLQIRGFTLGSVTAQDVKLQFNSDTATNYSIHYLQGNGTGAGAAGLASQTYIEIGITGTTTSPSGFVTDILDYTNTNKNKTARSLLGYDNNGSGYAILFSGYWNSTTAISTITLTPYSGTFNQYSSFSLYGIK